MLHIGCITAYEINWDNRLYKSLICLSTGLGALLVRGFSHNSGKVKEKRRSFREVGKYVEIVDAKIWSRSFDFALNTTENTN